MKNNCSSDRIRVGRRTFLKCASVAGAAVSLPLAGRVRGAQPTVALLTSERGAPISVEEMHAARKRIHKARGVPLRAETVPAGDHDGDIVAYSYGIGADGVPWQYTGVAGDVESAKTARETAARRASRADGGTITPAATTSSDVTTQSSSWNRVLHDEKDYYKDPYGSVTDNFDLFKLSNDGDSTQDAYSIKHFFAMEPGVQKYGSGWENDAGRPSHDWSVGNIGGPDLAQWDPLGTHDGSQTINVSIGTSGASLGWSYTQPAVTTIDNSSPSGNYAKWNEGFNTSNARRNTNGMQPGSRAWVDQHNSGKYHLMDLTSDGLFEDGDTYYLRFTWNVYVYP